MTNRAELFWRAVPLLIGLLILAGCTSPNEAVELAASEVAASDSAASDSAVSEPTASQSQDFEQIEESVEATVNAAIALAVEATIAARDAGVTSNPASETDAAAPSADAVEPSEAAEPNEIVEQGEEPDANATLEADTVAEAPVLFTPTPDQTVAIAQYVNANTRHFLGDADATVVLVEFSDFW